MQLLSLSDFYVPVAELVDLNTATIVITVSQVIKLRPQKGEMTCPKIHG